MATATTASNTAAPDAEAGKLHATLCYVVPFFLILPLVKRENGFSLFHAKQALTLWVAAVVASLALTIVFMINPVAIISTILSLAFSIAMIGAAVYGALQAWACKQQAFPVIGVYAEKHLAGIRVR